MKVLFVLVLPDPICGSYVQPGKEDCRGPYQQLRYQQDKAGTSTFNRSRIDNYFIISDF